MSGMLDHLGDKDSVERGRKIDIEGITRREMNGAKFLFQPYVACQLGPHVVPSDFVSHLRESDGKISLGGRDIENAGARREYFGDERKRGAAAPIIGVGVAAVLNPAVNFFQVIEIGCLP
jgi:hypothetical protein